MQIKCCMQMISPTIMMMMMMKKEAGESARKEWKNVSLAKEGREGGGEGERERERRGRAKKRRRKKIEREWSLVHRHVCVWFLPLIHPHPSLLLLLTDLLSRSSGWVNILSFHRLVLFYFLSPFLENNQWGWWGEREREILPSSRKEIISCIISMHSQSASLISRLLLLLSKPPSDWLFGMPFFFPPNCKARVIPSSLSLSLSLSLFPSFIRSFSLLISI